MATQAGDCLHLHLHLSSLSATLLSRTPCKATTSVIYGSLERMSDMRCQVPFPGSICLAAVLSLQKQSE